MQTPIEQFAEQHRLRVTRDECNDQIIEGSRAHLYFDGNSLCLMGLTTRVPGMSTENIQKLAGEWTFMGSITRDDRNRGLRDVWVRGIPQNRHSAAIKLARCRTAMNLSDADRQRRIELGKKLGAARRNKKPSIEPLESIGEP